MQELITPVTTPISFFQVEMDYIEPDLRLWLDRSNTILALYEALKRWYIGVDDVEIITTGKTSEQGVSFKIPQKKCSFFFGAAGCKFTRDSTDWETAPETIEILHTALTALTENTGVAIANRKTVIGLHIQPKLLHFMNVLAPLIPQPLAGLEKPSPESTAILVNWGMRRITIDASALVANGIFLKTERQFDTFVSYEEIARQLKADEDQIFAILGVEEVPA